MTTTDKMAGSWSEWTVLPCEHRIFKATDSTIRTSLSRHLSNSKGIQEFGAWAVADGSGATPERTDDGILWLNFNKNIMLGQDYESHIHIPIMKPNGEQSVFTTNAAGLFYLMDRFRWTANVVGTMYRVVRW